MEQQKRIPPVHDMCLSDVCLFQQSSCHPSPYVNQTVAWAVLPGSVLSVSMSLLYMSCHSLKQHSEHTSDFRYTGRTQSLEFVIGKYMGTYSEEDMNDKTCA